MPLSWVETDDNVTVLSVDAKMSVDDIDQGLREAVRSLLRNGCNLFLIDLSKLVYEDHNGLSAWVGILTRVYNLIDNQGGHLRLFQPNQNLIDYLTVCKHCTLNMSVVDHGADLESAIKKFQDINDR